jgi:hypothetical protein
MSAELPNMFTKNISILFPIKLSGFVIMWTTQHTYISEPVRFWICTRKVQVAIMVQLKNWRVLRGYKLCLYVFT